MKNISFVTNCSINTRDHVELLMRSLKDNLDGKQHEILVFVDSDNEGLTEYLLDIKKDFYDLKVITHSVKPCVGYSRNNNLLVQLAKHDIVSYLQSDMVIGPHYDTNILSQLEENCILAATRVEPPLHGYSDYTITENFGTDPTIFDMKKWNEYSESVKSNRAAEYFFAPITFYKSVWEKLGGYDTMFRRSREDSDLVQRAIQLGIRLLQTWEANVYHFSCVSSRGKNWFEQNNQSAQDRNKKQQLADQVELRRFVRRWGSFNHGEEKLNKFDVDFVIETKGDVSYLAHALVIEPYGSRLWFDDEKIRAEYLKAVSKEHELANSLLNFTESDWNFAQQFYNKTDYESIIKLGEPEEYNIKVIVSSLETINEFYSILHLLHKIIEQESVGAYEFAGVKIYIDRKVSVLPNMQIKNPDFDMSLVTVK